MQGSGYIGSSALETSVANAEIIPSAPAIWTQGYKIYKFAFYNTEACSIKINNGDAIYLRAGQGISIDQNDKMIENFCICENNIHYNYIAGY